MTRHYAAKQMTPRDRDLCSWIGQRGVATASQLQRRYWPGNHPRTAEDRLRQLVNAGYLARHYRPVQGQGTVLYTLTAAGRDRFPPSDHPGLQIGLPGLAELNQQIIAQEAYLWLESTAAAQGATLAEWRSERQLRSAWKRAAAASPWTAAAPHLADVQVQIQYPDGTRQTLEVEIDGYYRGDMLAEKIAGFGRRGDPILWICTTPLRATHVRHAAAAWTNIEVIVIPLGGAGP